MIILLIAEPPDGQLAVHPTEACLGSDTGKYRCLFSIARPAEKHRILPDFDLHAMIPQAGKSIKRLGRQSVRNRLRADPRAKRLILHFPAKSYKNPVVCYARS